MVGRGRLQRCDRGFDEYLRFQGSGKYWNTQNGAKTYTVNGKETPLLDGEYLPDKMHDFVLDFITRHKDQPFYVHYAMSHVHGQILRTPDSAPDSKDFYKDNVAYMDKLVGKLIAELDRLKLREKTLIVFSGDNGTAKQFAARCTAQGKPIWGCKNTMLECGALIPMIASWPGTTPAGKVSKNLVSFCDFFATFAELDGAKLPEDVTIDGKSIAPTLRSESDASLRDWIFVLLRRNWHDRDSGWKLNESGQLFDMRNSPFSEPLVSADSQDGEALAARKRLQAVLDQLNPSAGKVDPGGNSAKQIRKKKSRKAPAGPGQRECK